MFFVDTKNPTNFIRGSISITNPGNSSEGKDDYVLVPIYTFKNDIGEVASGTAGFNNNQFVNSIIVE